MSTILILANNDIGLYKFRKELLQELVKSNKVYISLPHGEYISKLEQLGCIFLNTPISRRGMNPFVDFKLFLNYKRILKKIKPDLVLTYTIKPNIYGGLACRLSKTTYLTTVTGLGSGMENGGILKSVLVLFYKTALKRVQCIFFQNETNRDFFEKEKISKAKYVSLPGSGVNLTEHNFEEYPSEENKIEFLFIGRIMKHKGIDELFEAIKTIKAKHPSVNFKIIGWCEEDYLSKLKDLQSDGLLEYLGYQDNVHDYIKDCHAVVLPSYHEGMSNVLLEAAATGRPVLASNISGCKETFDEVISGFGFEPRDTNGLIQTLEKFIELPSEEKKTMGIAGRKKIEEEFDRDVIVNSYLKEIENAIVKI